MVPQPPTTGTIKQCSAGVTLVCETRARHWVFEARFEENARSVFCVRLKAFKISEAAFIQPCRLLPKAW